MMDIQGYPATMPVSISTENTVVRQAYFTVLDVGVQPGLAEGNNAGAVWKAAKEP